jgi:hypothetical protein
MKPGKQILVVLSCGGMEITWRYAWALFLTLGILKRPFPLSESVAVFAMASLVTVLSGFKSWRLYQSLLLHIAGFTIAWLLTTYRFFYRHLSLFNISWTEDLFKQLQQPQQWLIQLLVFACLLLFWLGARAMMKRQQSYYPVCLQFDKGLGALFLLLLIKFMVQEKGGIRLEDAVTRYLLQFNCDQPVPESKRRSENISSRLSRYRHPSGLFLSCVNRRRRFNRTVLAIFNTYGRFRTERSQRNNRAHGPGPG